MTIMPGASHNTTGYNKPNDYQKPSFSIGLVSWRKEKSFIFYLGTGIAIILDIITMLINPKGKDVYND